MDFSTEQIQVHQKFYNDFYVLRLKVTIKDQPVVLEKGTHNSSYLTCDALNVQAPFTPLLRKIRPLLTKHCVATIVSCYSDPLPLLHVQFNEPSDVRNLLLHIDDIAPYIWSLIWDSFHAQIKTSTSSLSLFNDSSNEECTPNTIDALRLQHMFRSDNICQLELLYVSPNFTYKEVNIRLVTLANYESVTRVLTNSFVFDFQAAMNTFINDKSKLSFKDVVSLDDLKTELKSFSSWFHLGIATRMPFSTLMGILLNYKHRDLCKSQVLNLWYNRNTDAQGENQLTWTIVARVLASIGRKSIATSIYQHYGITISKSFEPLEVEVISAHGRLLSDEKVKKSLKDSNELEDQILEKARVVSLYNQQKKALEVSLESLEKELKSNIDDAYFALQMKQVSKRENDKITERIKALKITLSSFYSDVFNEDDLLLDNSTNEEKEEKESTEKSTVVKEIVEKSEDEGKEEEVVDCRQQEDSFLESKKQLRDMFYELKISGNTQSSDGELAVVRLKFLLSQIIVIYEKITKEYNLLVSKCHQIYQAESCLDDLRVDVFEHELLTDCFLQLEVASKSKSEAKVLKIQKEVIQEEMAQKDSITNTDYIEENDDLAAKQKEFDTLTSDVTEWMNTLKTNKKSDGDKSEINDELISELLENVEETMTRQKSLLKAKMSSWSAKRSHRLTAAEQNVLQLILDSLKADGSYDDDQTDGVHEYINESSKYSNSNSSQVECYLSLTETVHVNANKFINFIISINDKMKLYPKRIAYTADITSLANNHSVNLPLVWNASNSSLSVVFQPTIRGRHQLKIKANNKIIKTIKHYSFYVNQDPKMLGFPVRTIDSLNTPYNIQIVPNSTNMLISECKTRTITLRDKLTGKIQQTICSPMSKIKLPNGIAVDIKKGLVYVVDSASHCVHTFTLEGTPVNKIGSKGEAYSMFQYPYGIEISPCDGTVSICDHCNDRVQIFSSDMKFQKALYAVTPYDLAFDKNGYRYVTDHENHLIAVFNESLQCINSIAGKGTSEGKLLDPRGLAINEEGYIFVAEERNNRISVFNSVGDFVTCFGQEGSQSGEFNTPQGLTIDEDGYIYVCDMLNNRIQVF